MSSQSKHPTVDAASSANASEQATKSKHANANHNSKTIPAQQQKQSQSTAHKSWQLLGWTLVVVLLASSGAGYYLWNFVNQAKQQLQHDIHNLATRNTELSDTLRAAKDDFTETVKQLITHDDSLQNSIEEIYTKNIHLRKDWLIIEAEYLVKLASHRLTLEGDINTAIAALQSADARLREIGDPSMLAARKVLHQDITTLRAIGQADISGISLQLSSIIQQIDHLPLNTPDPQSTIDNQQQKTDIDISKWKQLSSELWQDLKGLITVRQHEQIVQPLLSPEQRFFLTQNLKLQLEQARTALLHTRAIMFEERLSVALDWIKLYFKNSAEHTKAAVAQLTELKNTNIKPQLPSLSASYQALQKLKAAIISNGSNTASAIENTPNPGQATLEKESSP